MDNLRATIDPNLRTMGVLRRMWHTTWTRGTNTTCHIIAQFAQARDIHVSVANDALFLHDGSQRNQILSSQHLAICLRRAGVTEVEIPKGSDPGSIEATLTALTEHDLTCKGINTKIPGSHPNVTVCIPFVDLSIRALTANEIDALANKNDLKDHLSFLATHPNISPKSLAGLIFKYLSIRISEQAFQPATDGYWDHGDSASGGGRGDLSTHSYGESRWVKGTSEIQAHPAYYICEDPQLAAKTINRHRIEKRETILQELAELDQKLADGIRPFVKL